jgi:hypothetical protein
MDSLIKSCHFVENLKFASATLFRRQKSTGNFAAIPGTFKNLHPLAPGCQKRVTNALTAALTAKCRWMQLGAK